MKYDASGQKPASANGFDPGVKVERIKDGGHGYVFSTNLGRFRNRVRVFFPNDKPETLFQTALTIVQPVTNRRS